MAVIITVFYFYTAISQKDLIWADIMTFILAVTVSYLFSYYYLNMNKKAPVSIVISGWFVLLLLVFSFMYFTYKPPHCPLFLDPISKKYGI